MGRKQQNIIKSQRVVNDAIIHGKLISVKNWVDVYHLQEALSQPLFLEIDDLILGEGWGEGKRKNHSNSFFYFSRTTFHPHPTLSQKNISVFRKIEVGRGLHKTQHYSRI